ncbi:MAG: polysaccharide lyase family 8 super-sandwich domain-containing protein, partial [Fusobacteriaceae bacterium]
PHELRTTLLKTSYSFQPYAELSGVTIQDGKESYSLKRVSTGGNRLDTAIIVLVRGILSEDEIQILDAIKAVPQVGEFVTTGDGFYTDGSFIQHDNVSYNGTYAAVLFSGLGNILNLTKDTKYQISDPRLENIYKIILEGYDPLLINGRVMDMVNGRSISRDNGSDLEKGRAILNSIAIISENVNEPYQSKLRALVKHNIETNSSYYLPDLVSDPKLKTIYDNIMNDNNIQYSKQDKSKFYLSTDRVVHKRKDYSLGIAMHSYRIANFETMNGENQKGWHTSDGATYLYTSDVEQYKDFWPTVDQYHLPGTTESIAPRKNMSGERRFKYMMSPKSWVG